MAPCDSVSRLDLRVELDRIEDWPRTLKSFRVVEGPGLAIYNLPGQPTRMAITYPDDRPDLWRHEKPDEFQTEYEKLRFTENVEILEDDN